MYVLVAFRVHASTMGNLRDCSKFYESCFDVGINKVLPDEKCIAEAFQDDLGWDVGSD
jgi:hypothetical protein